MKTFVEIGACDFGNLDDLLDKGWYGLFVEPVPKYNQSLASKLKTKTNYDIAQAAVTNKTGTVMMDILETTVDEEWIKGISHIHSNVIENTVSNLVHKNTNLGTPVQLEVQSYTLDDLLKHYRIRNIDILQMDVEGHELVILENYSWSIKPNFMKIEHKFIDDVRLRNLLSSQGYYSWIEKSDVYAILT